MCFCCCFFLIQLIRDLFKCHQDLFKKYQAQYHKGNRGLLGSIYDNVLALQCMHVKHHSMGYKEKLMSLTLLYTLHRFLVLVILYVSTVWGVERSYQ